MTEFGTISLPVLQLPPVINGNSGTFTWTPGAGPIHYELDLGSTFGNTNLYKSGVINTTTTTVLSMPASGTKVYAQLFYEIDGTWKSTEYSYIEP